MAGIPGQILHVRTGKQGILGAQPVAEDSQLQHLGEREIEKLVRQSKPGQTDKGLLPGQRVYKSGERTAVQVYN